MKPIFQSPSPLNQFFTKRKAKKIFDVEVLITLDSKPFDSNTFQQTGDEQLGVYKWWDDSVIIYSKIIHYFCKKYSVDFMSVFRFCLIHEIGHAREQRLFEEIDFFPDYIEHKSKHIPIQIESTDCLLRPSLVSEIFLNGIYDYSINEELKKHKYIDEISKKVFFDKTTHITKSNPKKRSDIILDYLLSLPKTLDIYEHGQLNDIDKITLKESQKEVIGEQWETTLANLRKIPFFNPQSKLDIILELIKNTLGIQIVLVTGPNIKTFFEGHTAIPNFYKKKYYRVLRLG